MDEFDPARFRLPDGIALGGGRRTSKKQKGERFVKFPLIWVERLVVARHIATYRVALHALHQHWRNRGQSFTLSNRSMGAEGVERRAKWRALRELEHLGLIMIERRKRRSPMITVLL
jgi:hypothetical protein